ncbi:hypothetical protein [Microbacterium sp.]|uniref:hypothetical protein n=1 Tax=Microbacterium sp. TaxID=51671 RepID=UPI0039E650ED
MVNDDGAVPDFEIPDGMIDHDVFFAQCTLVYETLLAGKDARPLLWQFVKESGDAYATLVSRAVFQPVGVFLYRYSTPGEAFKVSRVFADLIVLARELTLREELRKAPESPSEA